MLVDAVLHVVSKHTTIKQQLKINKENHNNPERLERSRKLANKVQQNLLYQTGANDRGVKRASFTVLRETSIPSILVELGFIDNPEERNKIKTNEYQERLANGIVDGIVEYYKQVIK